MDSISIETRAENDWVKRVLREEDVQALETSHPLIAMKMHRMMAGNLANQVRSIQKFFTHRPVLTFDRVFFQLTDELFLYGMALR